MAHPANLDVNAIRRTETLTDGLTKVLGSRKLWVDYGIDDSVIVCSQSFLIAIF
jgi:hypothetical protein